MIKVNLELVRNALCGIGFLGLVVIKNNNIEILLCSILIGILIPITIIDERNKLNK